MKPILIYTDGAARGNPGPAAAGWCFCDESGVVLKEGKRFLGELTNNQAEYQALLLALEEAKKTGIQAIRVYSDSELMVRQLKGEYKVKNEGLKPLYQKAVLTLRAFAQYSLTSIPREKNEIADRLANEAIDGAL